MARASILDGVVKDRVAVSDHSTVYERSKEAFVVKDRVAVSDHSFGGSVVR